MLRSLLSACVTATLAFAALPSYAVIVGDDDLRVLPASNSDPSTVAFVSGQTDSIRCTGTTIGLAQVITSAECLYDIKTGQLKSGITLFPGLHVEGKKRLTNRFHIKRAFILESFIQDVGYNGYTSYAASKDIAIVQVLEYKGNTKFSDLSPALKVGNGMQIDLSGQPFQVIGYASARGYSAGSQYYRQGGCKSVRKRPSYTAIEHDCDTVGGSAGMGMVVNQNTVIGIHTGKAAAAPRNSAALITEGILPDIRKIIQFDFDTLETFRAFDWPDPSYGRIRLKNSCRKDIQIGLRYQDLAGQWVSDGFYRIKAGTEYHFHEKLRSDHLYYFAATPDGTLRWEGDHRMTVRGQNVRGKRLNFPQYHSDHRLNIKCD